MAKLDRFIIDNTTYEIVPEIAPLFNPATSYSVGGCVIHDAVLYKFTANHAAGAWTGNDVVAFEVGSELVRLGSGASGSGLTEDVKVALLACFEKVAWIDEDGQDYYDALYSALYPPADLVSISAVFTQSGTVYEGDSLDSLKPDLVVTAHFSDSSTQTVTIYALSGTLVEGTSTITVIYSGKTTTFNVTVSQTATVNNISAVYTQSGTVYNTDTLDSLKTDLVVTAHMSDSSTRTVVNYELSGTLTEGTSTITVTYNGKTTTFNVVVSHQATTVQQVIIAGTFVNSGVYASTYDSNPSSISEDVYSIADVKAGDVIQLVTNWNSSNVIGKESRWISTAGKVAPDMTAGEFTKVSTSYGLYPVTLNQNYDILYIGINNASSGNYETYCTWTRESGF